VSQCSLPASHHSGVRRGIFGLSGATSGACARWKSATKAELFKVRLQITCSESPPVTWSASGRTSTSSGNFQSVWATPDRAAFPLQLHGESAQCSRNDSSTACSSILGLVIPPFSFCRKRSRRWPQVRAFNWQTSTTHSCFFGSCSCVGWHSRCSLGLCVKHGQAEARAWSPSHGMTDGQKEEEDAVSDLNRYPSPENNRFP
jgi:hypothetical protein